MPNLDIILNAQGKSAIIAMKYILCLSKTLCWVLKPKPNIYELENVIATHILKNPNRCLVTFQ